MEADEEIAVQRVLFLEVLNRLIMPSLDACQQGDKELDFSSGFLTRQWPGRVIRDIDMPSLMC